MTTPTILGIFAHPDDELMCGGTLARYAAQGARVVLACATRGEVGSIYAPGLATRETLADVRSGELQTAARALGIAEVRFLGFRDSGMAGTPENDDPRNLLRADPEPAMALFVGLLREVRPDVVLTHDPTGGYGHPDHIAVSGYVTAAYDAAGDPARYPHAGEAWRPARLFYGVMARSFFARMREALEQAGAERMPFGNADLDRMGYDDNAVSLALDVSDQVAAKIAGFLAHQTQFGPESPSSQMPEDMRQAMLAHEHLVQARPALPPGVRLNDLWG